MKILGKRILSAMVALLITLILSHLPAGALGAPSGGKNFLWKASSDSGVVYILGSIHFFKSELYPLDEKIEEAFGRSDVLAVEAGVNNIGDISPMKLLERSLYPEGDSIEKHVSAETMALLRESLERTGMPPALFRVQKPWFIALTLTSLELMRLGFDPQYGIDNHFLSEATGKKKVVELESLEYQIDLLSGLSDEEQEAFLLYSLRDLRTIDREADKLLRAWQTGNVAAMEEIVSKSTGSDRAMSGFLEKILYERNRHMGSKIAGFLETKKTYFVVVGAAHLIGEKGILEILRSKGYSVEQMLILISRHAFSRIWYISFNPKKCNCIQAYTEKIFKSRNLVHMEIYLLCMKTFSVSRQQRNYKGGANKDFSPCTPEYIFR